MRSGVLNKLNIEEILGMSEYEFLKEAVTGTYVKVYFPGLKMFVSLCFEYLSS